MIPASSPAEVDRRGSQVHARCRACHVQGKFRGSLRAQDEPDVVGGGDDAGVGEHGVRQGEGRRRAELDAAVGPPGQLDLADRDAERLIRPRFEHAGIGRHRFGAHEDVLAEIDGHRHGADGQAEAGRADARRDRYVDAGCRVADGDSHDVEAGQANLQRRLEQQARPQDEGAAVVVVHLDLGGPEPEAVQGRQVRDRHEVVGPQRLEMLADRDVEVSFGDGSHRLSGSVARAGADCRPKRLVTTSSYDQPGSAVTAMSS